VQRRDHHRWSESEIKRVLADANDASAAVVTTEKDAVKWQTTWLAHEQAVVVWSLCITLKMLPNEVSFDAWLRAALRQC
jgi:tetraacyldisaccharide-1-P 4'-kinase